MQAPGRGTLPFVSGGGAARLDPGVAGTSMAVAAETTHGHRHPRRTA